MSNAGFSITHSHKRPSRALVDGFDGIPVTNIGDSLNRMGAVSSHLRPISGERVCGPAYTVAAPAGDNLLFYYAIDNAQPGDVLVVSNEGFTGRALCGGIMAYFAKQRGIAGFVIDGAVRDQASLVALDFPVFATAVSPNGPYKNGPGEINCPVTLGGKVVHPGDIIVGDAEGVVVIRPDQADDVQKKARAIMEKENCMIANIEREGRMDLEWMYEKLKADGCDFV